MNQRHLPDYPVASDMVCPLCGGTACFCVGSENNNCRKFDCEKYNRCFAIGSTIFDCADDREKRRRMNLVFEHIIERNKYLFYFYDDKYEIKEHIATLSTNDKGWSKELNLISWNDREPVFDIRTWDADHKHMGKGITLTEEEVRILGKVLG